MKSSQHVHSFLSSARGNGEIDELAIIQYCARFGVKAEFSNMEKEPRKITFEQFKEWFSYDFPQKNDVIVFNETSVIGIVEKCGYNSFVTGVSLSPDGELDISPVEFTEPLRVAFRSATENEMVRMQKAFNKAGLAWNKKFGKLASGFVPTDNSLIRISLLTKRVGIGVFKEVDTDGNIIMYCVKMEDEPLRHSLCENIGKADGISDRHDYNARTPDIETGVCKSGKSLERT